MQIKLGRMLEYKLIPNSNVCISEDHIADGGQKGHARFFLAFIILNKILIIVASFCITLCIKNSKVHFHFDWVPYCIVYNKNGNIYYFILFSMFKLLCDFIV